MINNSTNNNKANNHWLIGA